MDQQLIFFSYEKEQLKIAEKKRQNELTLIYFLQNTYNKIISIFNDDKPTMNATYGYCLSIIKKNQKPYPIKLYTAQMPSSEELTKFFAYKTIRNVSIFNESFHADNFKTITNYASRFYGLKISVEFVDTDKEGNFIVLALQPNLNNDSASCPFTHKEKSFDNPPSYSKSKECILL